MYAGGGSGIESSHHLDESSRQVMRSIHIGGQEQAGARRTMAAEMNVTRGGSRSALELFASEHLEIRETS